MTDLRRALAAASGLATLVALAAAQAQTPPLASNAASLQANFTADNMSTSLGPIAPAQGTAPPAYSDTVIVASYSGSVAVPPLVPSPTIYPIVANFHASASKLRSHVESPGIGIDNASASGRSDLATASLEIANPPGPSVVPPPFLVVGAGGVSASASYDKVFPATATVTGRARFGSLAISASLLGGAVINFSGPAPKNTVLYRSPTVTVTVDQQTVSGIISCIPCKFTPTGISVHALDIGLTGAVIDGHPVTGDIALGIAAAQ